MSTQTQEPVQSVQAWLAGINAQADAIAEKFAQVHRDIKAARDEEAEYDRRMMDIADDVWAARAADQDDGEEAVPA